MAIEDKPPREIELSIKANKDNLMMSQIKEPQGIDKVIT